MNFNFVHHVSKQGRFVCWMVKFDSRKSCRITQHFSVRFLSNTKSRTHVTWPWRKLKLTHCLAALSLVAGLSGCALLVWPASTFMKRAKLASQKNLLDEEQDETLGDRFKSPGLYYTGIDHDWIIYSSILWGNVLKAWLKLYIYEAINFNVNRIWDWLFPWEKSKSDDPLMLLELTKSSNFWIRQMGVASLANKTDWDSYKYRTVAQACSHRTTVALARYPQANNLFFLPPPKVVASQNSILEDLRLQVSKLPLPPCLQSNIYYYRHAALDAAVTYQKDPLVMDTMAHFYSMPWEEEKQKSKALRFCLQALLCYTAVSSYGRMFVENHGLSVLLRLREEHTDPSVTMYIANILCNLSHDESLMDDIVSTGWVSILREWSESSSTALSVSALTTLANLDRDWTGHELYRDMVLLHPTQRNSQGVSVDVVFVHGLRGGAVKTWRQRDKTTINDVADVSTCWPKDWLAADCPNARIVSIGYNSAMFCWGEHCPYEQERRTLEGRGRDMLSNLKKAGVGSRPIIWVGHSMGGLLIKQIIDMAQTDVEYSNLAHQTKGVLFYSVPHKGSSLVDVVMYAKYLLFPSVEVQEMNTRSEKLHSLHNKFVEFMTTNNIPCLSFGENAKTPVGAHLPDVWMVPPDSSNPGIGQFVCLPTNHIDTCKPCDEEDVVYQKSRQFLRDVMLWVKR